MPLIGLIGGTTWHSTAEYYRLLNELTWNQTDGQDFARVLINSLNFGELKRNNEAGTPEKNREILIDAGHQLKNGGATHLMIGANTLHQWADEVEAAVGLPVINLLTATAEAILARGHRRVGLLGTRYTMEQGFYQKAMAKHGIEIVLPAEGVRDYIHQTIFEDFAAGLFTPEAKFSYKLIIDELAADGAEGVILGCTEIPILLAPNEISLPSYDTTQIHVEAALAVT